MSESSPAAQQDPPWLAVAVAFLRPGEAFRERAYPDPDSGGEPWTIGYGSTFWKDGRAVRRGETITHQQALELMEHVLLTRFEPAARSIIKPFAGWVPHQQAAILSFVYNAGEEALRTSTLARRLNAGEDPDQVVREELPRWIAARDPGVRQGLLNRRRHEIALFTENVLPVKWDL